MIIKSYKTTLLDSAPGLKFHRVGVRKTDRLGFPIVLKMLVDIVFDFAPHG